MDDFRYMFYEKSDTIMITPKFERRGRSFDDIKEFIRLEFKKKGIKNLGEFHRMISIVDSYTLECLYVIYSDEKIV